ncbi:PD-(D/E)XK nuclease family protein [Thiomicrorhabdus sp. Milos-T2]|uniref:PD-(D/E)XK nuclease family protein n=1 Tax=Thiomicrorhabdus sp. Milos-T2 TaxID=90814 RepID=UPI00049458B7|nr:PD-(D/E)XK nuclease family protein [Thiomicrorhabdus sp. Milos-T2]
MAISKNNSMNFENEQTIFITANSRLTAVIKERAILSSGQKVIQTPNVMTLNQWWQLWQNNALLAGELPASELPKKVLTSFEAQWLMEQCLQEELDERLDDHENSESESEFKAQQIALLNIHTTAKQLYQAWSLSAEWLPNNWHEEHFLNEETQLFKTVLQRYLQRLKNKHWQDEALQTQQRLTWLNNHNVGKTQLPQRFFLHGFDDLSPNIQAWRLAVESMGCHVELDSEVSRETMELPDNGLSCYAAQDLFDEVQQVANWAINQVANLLKKKDFKNINVAVVAPNVADYKTALIQCLDEQLYLNGLQQLNTQANISSNQTKLYNLSLGEPLFSVPIIENAWQTLSLFLQPHKSTTYQAWSQWLISPYTQGDFTQRQQADAEFRRLQWANVLWPNLLDTQAAKTLPQSLKNSLLKVVESSQTKGSVTLVDFINQAWSVLETLGWPGNRTLQSVEFQQKTAFENALVNFSKLADIGGKQSYSKWLSLLKRYLSELVHQPQSVGHQPIQIMGMLEAGGQEFDALWIMGLTNEAWPRMPSPNPFLPMALQRQFHLPRSDANRELSYALQISQRLLLSANQVIWSYPQQTGEATLLPSSILPSHHQMPQSVVAYPKTKYQTLAECFYDFRNSQDGLLWEEDWQGAEIPLGQQAPGGTGILQAQSQCPLMAYIDYRLGAKYGFQQVEDSLQNTNQGTLIHQVLEHFWLEVKTQVALLSLSQDERVDKLNTHIEEAFASLQASLAKGLLEVEQKRVLELCLEWLELETQRSSFKVVEREKSHDITLAGIKFKVIIDRVDEVDGQKVILDYKTGKASINSLFKTPLAAPQLAVYLEAINEDVSGIGYALLHSDEGVKFSAVVEEEAVLYKQRSIKVFSNMANKEGGDYYETTWHEFLDSLKQQVVELATQIQQGQAQMSFASLNDIEYAAGHLALRVPEVLQQRKDTESLISEQEGV